MFVGTQARSLEGGEAIIQRRRVDRCSLPSVCLQHIAVGLGLHLASLSDLCFVVFIFHQANTHKMNKLLGNFFNEPEIKDNTESKHQESGGRLTSHLLV